MLAETEWKHFQRYHRTLSIMLVDIDHFKEVNDRCATKLVTLFSRS
jgi:PleD family two-component response regulator